MYSNLDCFACVVRRATEAVKHSGLDRERQGEILSEVLKTLSAIGNPNNGSADMIKQTFQVIRDFGDIHDPLENVKSYCMDVALRAYPELKHTLDQAEDRFSTAVRIAMAGNIIDHSREDLQDNLALFRSIEDALSRPLVINHIDALKEEVSKASKILYLADNAGETVFDRILIEEMPTDRIVYGVKGSPVSVDATLRDAAIAGLTDVVEVKEDGSDFPALYLDRCSDDFRNTFEEADLVIAKGQANLKSLGSLDKNIFFLVRIRCKVTAYQSKLSVGDFLVKGLRVES